MNRKTLTFFLSVLISVFCLGGTFGCLPAHAVGEEFLEAWNDKATLDAIKTFVEKVNTEGILAEDRIAVFDNDGTLWTERPQYFQQDFMENYPSSSRGQFSLLPKKAKNKGKTKGLDIISDEIKTALQDVAIFDGITTDEYISKASDFVNNYDHPDYAAKYKDLTYEPVIGLVNYLKANDFQVYICSGGGRDFVRSFAQDAYGIPTENVIGSGVKTKFEDDGNGGALVRQAMLAQYNDKQGKPVGIERQIGKRPIIAVGNSTGDLQMFQYTDDGKGANSDSLIVLINHDDCDREYRYNFTEDYNSNEGEYYNESLVEANKPGHENWIVASMQKDFKSIFESQPSRSANSEYCEAH